MIQFWRLMNKFLAFFSFSFIILPDHCSKHTFKISKKIFLLFCCFSALSLGGLFKSLIFIGLQTKNSITTSFQSKKKAHFDSILNLLDFDLNESIKMAYGMPSTVIDCRINKASIPELISNPGIISHSLTNSLNQLYFKNDFQYRLPPKPPLKQKSRTDNFLFACPSEGRITSHFGKRTDPVFEGTAIHNGIDIGTPTGTPIAATADGIIKFTGNKKHWGNVVIIDHAKGYQTIYAHLHKFNTSIGDTITHGQTIGYSGNTGKSTGPHLHYEIRYLGKPLNPLQYLLPESEIAD